MPAKRVRTTALLQVDFVYNLLDDLEGALLLLLGEPGSRLDNCLQNELRHALKPYIVRRFIRKSPFGFRDVKRMSKP